MSRPAGWDEAERIATLVETALPGRISNLTLDLDGSVRGITAVMYDAFVFRVGIEQPRGNLAAAILLDGGRTLTAPFGNRFTLNANDTAIRGVLAQMDEWARLRLPEPYLTRFGVDTAAGAAANSTAVDADAGVASTPPEYFAKITYRDGIRVPVRVFRVDGGVDQVYRVARDGWGTDDDGILREHRLGVRDHELWPVTRLQAGQAINMIESGRYHPLDIPGLFD